MPIVPRETTARLETFLDLLRLWTSRQQLVSTGDLRWLRTRHLQDSLSILPFVPFEGTIADFGSGAGFPGLVVAIAAGRPVVLIEANQRKAAFLREAVRVTAAPATVVNSRVEAVTATFDTITARALAPLSGLLELASPRMAPDARCLFIKGRRHEEEIAAARAKWDFCLAVHACASNPEGRLLEISNVRLR